MTIEKEGRSVCWRYIPHSAWHRKNPTATVNEHKRSSMMELPRFPRLKYEKTETGTDLEYSVNDQGIKENIILAKPPKHSAFSFDLKLTGLRAKLTEDNKAIHLFADDSESCEPVFIIPPVNMTDDAGVYSEDAHYELSEDENGNTVMSVVIDPEWLFSEDRLYPVTVDPQININNDEISSPDSFVSVSSDGTSNITNSQKSVGIDSIGNKHRLYFKCDYPQIPSGTKITKAKLVLHQSEYLGNGGYFGI